jgi:segregation and condensation protein B
MDRPAIPINLLRLVEAFVFASPTPVTPRALASVLPDFVDPYEALTALRTHCAERGVILVEAGEGWSFRTAPDLADDLRPALAKPLKLPRVAMETLVVIALHQPVTRPEIEEIRGMSLAQQTVDALLDAGLIQPLGRRETAGRPALWGTTDRFLAQFGLRSLRDLPGSELAWPKPQPAPAMADPPAEDETEAGRGPGEGFEADAVS